MQWSNKSMSNFKKLLHERATQAAQLPSFPQKGQNYNIDAQNPSFDAIEDTYMEERFGRKVWRKQTLYLINTKEGVLRISPNQMQQLGELLESAAITEKTELVEVVTSEGAEALKFEFVGLHEATQQKSK